jgi:hypothetical protein
MNHFAFCNFRSGIPGRVILDEQGEASNIIFNEYGNPEPPFEKNEIDLSWDLVSS